MPPFFTRCHPFNNFSQPRVLGFGKRIFKCWFTFQRGSAFGLPLLGNDLVPLFIELRAALFAATFGVTLTGKTCAIVSPPYVLCRRRSVWHTPSIYCILSSMNSTSPDLAYWLALSHLCQGRQLKKLYDHYGRGEAAWSATAHELTALGFQATTIERLQRQKRELDPIALEQKTKAAGIATVLLTDPDYPARLMHIADPPVLLFYRGTLPTPDEPLLAVVGTRAPSSYGVSVTATLVRDLARAGLTIVSGLMRGIDGLAHEATLEVGGRTIGVPGTGLLPNDLYPREHVKLTRRILEHGGALVSEYPPGVGPERHHFPERNRIVAGLALGTLVIEAPEKSGALITARLALEENREVMAVPGNLFAKNSVGTNALLKLGAHLVASADDVLHTLGLERRGRPSETVPVDLSPDERAVLGLLAGEPLHVDTLRQRTGLSSANLGAALSLLELKGLVQDIGGKNYIRI